MHHTIRPAHLVFCLAVVACSGETSFSDADVETNPDQGSGAMTITPAELTIPVDAPGVLYSGSIVIASVGKANLQLYQVGLSESADGLFGMEIAEDVILAPGTDKTFTVTAILDTGEIAEGEVRISSNDAAQLEVRVPIHATPTFGDTGAPGDTGK